MIELDEKALFWGFTAFSAHATASGGKDVDITAWLALTDAERLTWVAVAASSVRTVTGDCPDNLVPALKWLMYRWKTGEPS